MKATLATVVAVGACTLWSGPAAAQSPNLPSYATGEESIRGRIASIDGKYALQLRDDRGFIDNVSLHEGTIINPTGLRLSPGQSVTILGHNTGKTFEANEIDTAYAMYGFPPAYAYGFGPYPYDAYPYRGYPGFRLGIRSGNFGFRGWF